MRPLTGFISCGRLIILSLICAQAAPAQSNFLDLQNRVIEIFEETRNAIVRVKAANQRETEDGESQTYLVIGTGFFISREGHVITSAKTTFNSERVWVEHNDIPYAAEIIGSDNVTNLSILRLINLPPNFNFLHLTDSVDLPEIGTMVLRISAPFEFDPTPHLGLITGRESNFAQRIFRCTYLRTNIPAGPGEDGSALLDLNGRLIGIMVASLPDVQGSYALPARAALRIRDDLLFSGKVTYGWVGFEVAVQKTLAEGSRIVINEVFEDSPAEEVGLLPDDVLRKIADHEIRTVNDLRNAIFYTRVGQYVGIKVDRDGHEVVFNVRMAARPPDEPLEIHKALASKGKTPTSQEHGEDSPPLGEPISTGGSPLEGAAKSSEMPDS